MGINQYQGRLAVEFGGFVRYDAMRKGRERTTGKPRQFTSEGNFGIANGTLNVREGPETESLPRIQNSKAHSTEDLTRSAR